MKVLHSAFLALLLTAFLSGCEKEVDRLKDSFKRDSQAYQIALQAELTANQDKILAPLRQAWGADKCQSIKVVVSDHTAASILKDDSNLSRPYSTKFDQDIIVEPCGHYFYQADYPVVYANTDSQWEFPDVKKEAKEIAAGFVKDPGYGWVRTIKFDIRKPAE